MTNILSSISSFGIGLLSVVGIFVFSAVTVVGMKTLSKTIIAVFFNKEEKAEKEPPRPVFYLVDKPKKKLVERENKRRLYEE